MSDTITVEVDGELGEPDYLPERPRPSWGMPAAAVVVVLLLVGLGWTLVSGGGSVEEPSATPSPTTVVPASAPSTIAPRESSSTTSTTAAPVEEPAVDLTDPASAAAAALDAWGEFAATGDLSIVETVFDRDGPQYAQLSSEEVDPSGGVPYDVTIEQPEVTVEGDVAHVRGTVVWSRVGEAEQRYEWSIELHRAAGEWRLWTVRTVGA